jgi:hypothetical protein
MLDPSLAPREEPDDISSYDIRLEMGSVYAQHGLDFYMDSCVVIENRADLAKAMLASSSNGVAIGKLLASSIASEAILHGGLARKNLSSSLTQIKYSLYGLFHVTVFLKVFETDPYCYMAFENNTKFAHTVIDMSKKSYVCYCSNSIQLLNPINSRKVTNWGLK